MQVLKQRVAKQLLREQHDKQPGKDVVLKFWQPRFYDFNVYSRSKHTEKLNYMHQNPVKRGLVSQPEEWKWSSYRFYAEGQVGTVKLNL